MPEKEKHIGKVKIYSFEARSGLIVGDDGLNHLFEFKDWTADIEPEKGQEVEYTLSDHQARSVRLKVA